VDVERLRDRVTDGEPRVQRRERILEDHLDVAAHGAQLGARHLGDVAALELDAAGAGSTRRRSERPVVDLPHPDSPTSASVSPGPRSKLTRSTA
jgi:hypothetical protein